LVEHHGAMLPKVIELMSLVEDGYAISNVEPNLMGALAITVTKGNLARTLNFASYEVPAIHQECNVVGLAK